MSGKSQEINKIAFINKANKVHNFKFDYSKFKYINAKTKSIITCPIHGDFEQNPDKHLNTKYGCKMCADENKNKNKVPVVQRESISKEEYINRFYTKYGTKFKIDLSKYEGLTQGKVTLICPTHGESDYVPRSLLVSTYGCKFCGTVSTLEAKTKSYNNFLLKAKNIYGDFYEYPESNKDSYKNRKSMVEIICPIHGTFNKSARKHLAGQACFQCRMQKLIDEGKYLGGYSEKLFEDNQELKNKEAIIYYIKVGELYKVGITTNLYNRMKSIKSESKSEVEILDKLQSNLFDVYKMEQYILNKYDSCRVYHKWSTELFSQNILLGEKLIDYQNV